MAVRAQASPTSSEMGDTRVTWQSVRWQDGSSFEGACREAFPPRPAPTDASARRSDKPPLRHGHWLPPATRAGLVNDNELCHVRGVFRYPGGDRYEGEYFENHMQGFGVYVWKDGT